MDRVAAQAVIRQPGTEPQLDHPAALPHVPLGIDDRAADNWWPLLAIADAAGGDWPNRARRAAEVLSISRDDEESIGVRLLTDIRHVFDEAQVERMHTTELVERLLSLEDAPWGSINRGKAIDANFVSRKLKAFGAKPVQIKIQGRNRNGYHRRAFEEPWRRYLPAILGASAIYPSTIGGNADGWEDPAVYPAEPEVGTETARKPQKPPGVGA